MKGVSMFKAFLAVSAVGLIAANPAAAAVVAAIFIAPPFVKGACEVLEACDAESKEKAK